MEIDVRKCVCARAPGVCVRAPVPLLAGGQVYVSETVCTVDDVKDIVHFIAAKPEDVPLGQAPPNSRSLCLGLSLPGWKEGGRGKGQIWQMGFVGQTKEILWLVGDWVHSPGRVRGGIFRQAGKISFF